MRKVFIALALLTLMGCRTIPRPRAYVTLPVALWPRDTQIRWYDITGDTEGELRSQLDARGFDTGEGRRADAYTRWHVTWKVQFAHPEEGGCTIGSVSTDVRVWVTLPRWLGFTDERDPLMRKWRTYLNALKEHESGHRELGFRAATDIAEALPETPAQATCEGVEKLADETAAEIVKRYLDLDVEYDIETKHGVTQGALFP